MIEEKIPVTESTLSALYLGRFLQAKYNMGPSTTCKLFRTGINHLYVVSTNDSKFVFRVYTMNLRTRLEVSEEVRLLNHLKTHSIPVAYPIADANDNYIQELDAPEGKRFGVLFSYALGEKVREFTERSSFTIGQAMANMHKVTENFSLKRIVYSEQTLLIDSFESSKAFFQKSSPHMKFVEKASKDLTEEYKHVNGDDVRDGAIHLDIWFDNMHFNGEDQITIFDFDFCGNGWLCHDIAYFLVQLYNTRESDDAYEQKSKSFIKGYESVKSISREEQRIIPMLGVSIWLFYLGVQCDRFDNWSNVFLNEDHLKRFISTIKKWIEYNRLPIEI